MASSVLDFRNYSRTTITLPSGLTVLIRKCQQQDFLARGDLPVLSSRSTPAPQNDDTLRDNIALSDLVIVRCTIAPRFVPRNAPESEEALGVEELDPEDYTALVDGILRHSGMLREVAADIEAFRTDEQRETHSPDGREVPRSTAHDIAMLSTRILPELSTGNVADRAEASELVGASATTDNGTPGPSGSASGF